MTTDCLRLTLDSRLDELDRLAGAIDGFCAAAGREGEAPAFTLCAEELVTNVIVHGHRGEAGHSIAVTLTRDAGRIDVEILDDAPPFDPTVPVSPDLDAAVEDRAVGGLGRHLVSTMMDRFCYARDRGRNRVVFGRGLRGGDGG